MSLVEVAVDEILDQVVINPSLNVRPLGYYAHLVPAFVDKKMMAIANGPFLRRGKPTGQHTFAVKQAGGLLSRVEPPDFRLGPVYPSRLAFPTSTPPLKSNGAS